MSFSHVKHVLFEHNQRSFLSLKEELSPQLCQTHPDESIWGGAVWPFFPSSEKAGQSLVKPILHLNCARPMECQNVHCSKGNADELIHQVLDNLLEPPAIFRLESRCRTASFM